MKHPLHHVILTAFGFACFVAIIVMVAYAAVEVMKDGHKVYRVYEDGKFIPKDKSYCYIENGHLTTEAMGLKLFGSFNLDDINGRWRLA